MAAIDDALNAFIQKLDTFEGWLNTYNDDDLQALLESFEVYPNGDKPGRLEVLKAALPGARDDAIDGKFHH